MATDSRSFPEDSDTNVIHEETVSVVAKDLHRVIVVAPTRSGGSYLMRMYESIRPDIPMPLVGFEDEVSEWCNAYVGTHKDVNLVEVNLEVAVYWFDLVFERVVIAYGVSSVPDAPRDVVRIRRFPDVSIGVNKTMGDNSFEADRGHFLSHAAGGELDINLFPQRRELNRGWSSAGKHFRRMEKVAAENPGTFHFHRALYDDDTWIPATLVNTGS